MKKSVLLKVGLTCAGFVTGIPPTLVVRAIGIPIGLLLLPILGAVGGYALAFAIDRKKGITEAENRAACDPIDPWKRPIEGQATEEDGSPPK